MSITRECYLCGRTMQLVPAMERCVVCADCWKRYKLTDDRLVNGGWSRRPFDRKQPTASVAPPNDLSDPPTIEF